MLRHLVFGMAVIVLSSISLYGQAAGTGDTKVDPSISASVLDALKKLDNSSDNTAASRINLAKVAIQNKAWEAARDVLADALRLEPANVEAKDLMRQVEKNMPPPPPPTTKPVTPPPPVNPGPGPATKPAPERFTVKREVTPAEINRIRQLEWRPDEKPTPIVKLDQETQSKFLAASPDVTPGDFRKTAPAERAALILASGKAQFFDGVTITTDPASIKDFKTSVNNVIIQSCGNCHVSNKAGRFSLYTDKNSPPAIYTNFLTLQSYAAFIGGAERLMVDRTNPEGSMLVQFMLPSGVADTPHPNVTGFKAPAKTVNDAKYQLLLKWLKSLDSIAPQYHIDLSADLPAKPAAK